MVGVGGVGVSGWCCVDIDVDIDIDIDVDSDVEVDMTFTDNAYVNINP